MVSSTQENLIHNHKLSSVGPGQCTGSDVVHHPFNIDLAMKLHYIRGVYLFSSQAVQGVTIMNIKEAFFTWLSYTYRTCGRFRRSESGRPYIKCNDCGVRCVEAECDQSVDEWLQMEDSSLTNKLLAYEQVIGPELTFSPLLFIQITRFKCGGIAVGLSWAHVLGDIFSASNFINMWGKVMAGIKPINPDNIKRPIKPENPLTVVNEPVSIKRVDPVGDLWTTANASKMETFCFNITATQLSHLQSEISSLKQIDKITPFQCLCASIWQCVAKVKQGKEPKMVTICKKDPQKPEISGCPSNNQIISLVKAEFSVVDAHLHDLVRLLVDQATDEKSLIEEAVEKDNGIGDFLVYGANLTFVDLEGCDLYGLELNGQKPAFVNYTVHGVGDEGAVLVLPWLPKNSNNNEDDKQGRVVNVILPENELVELKAELKKNGLLS